MLRWYSAERLSKLLGEERAEGEWIDLDKLPRRHVSHGPAVIGDVKPFRSMMSGKMITTRRQHRDELRAHGCIEIGTEPVTGSSATRDIEPDHKDIVDDIKRAIVQGPPPGMKEHIARAENVEGL